jgi:hypothetical protein
MTGPAVTVKAPVTTPELMINVVVVGLPALRATIDEGGNASRPLLLLSVSVVPPAGAGWLSVTVQLLDALWLRLVGLQLTLDTDTGGTRLIVATCERLPSVAVTIAL